MILIINYYVLFKLGLSKRKNLLKKCREEKPSSIRLGTLLQGLTNIPAFADTSQDLKDGVTSMLEGIVIFLFFITNRKIQHYKNLNTTFYYN